MYFLHGYLFEYKLAKLNSQSPNKIQLSNISSGVPEPTLSSCDNEKVQIQSYSDCNTPSANNEEPVYSDQKTTYQKDEIDDIRQMFSFKTFQWLLHTNIKNQTDIENIQNSVLSNELISK